MDALAHIVRAAARKAQGHPDYPVIRLIVCLEELETTWVPELHRKLMAGEPASIGTITNPDFLRAAEADLKRASEDRDFAKGLIETCNRLEKELPEKRKFIKTLRTRLLEMDPPRNTGVSDR